ncbi:hypothetical protein V565_155000 [Rhizoctonia solani 123E]|uniref:Uncharacterized protein n=1 Tax=Rhizoctonia solani 123E TaxID=1423351 RepID=A0A074RRZ1_9AGAM|nr:hypothetical protein V565_155000 [Rhizoctonia solani 123E]
MIYFRRDLGRILGHPLSQILLGLYRRKTPSTRPRRTYFLWRHDYLSQRSPLCNDHRHIPAHPNHHHCHVPCSRSPRVACSGHEEIAYLPEFGLSYCMVGPFGLCCRVILPGKPLIRPCFSFVLTLSPGNQCCYLRSDSRHWLHPRADQRRVYGGGKG